jgi:hypothetical protein
LITNINMSRSAHFYWFLGPVDAPIGQITKIVEMVTCDPKQF